MISPLLQHWLYEYSHGRLTNTRLKSYLKGSLGPEERLDLILDLVKHPLAPQQSPANAQSIRELQKALEGSQSRCKALEASQADRQADQESKLQQQVNTLKLQLQEMKTAHAKYAILIENNLRFERELRATAEQKVARLELENRQLQRQVDAMNR